MGVLRGGGLGWTAWDPPEARDSVPPVHTPCVHMCTHTYTGRGSGPEVRVLSPETL